MYGAKQLKSLYLAILAVILTSLCVSPSANADEKSAYTQIKGKKQLLALFTDQTAVSEYRMEGGGIEDELYTELHFNDGSTDYIEKGAESLKGIWKIVGDDKICYKYPTSTTFTQTYCFVVYKNESCYYNYSTRSMTIHGPYDWDMWVSRFIMKGQGGTCAVGVS